MVTRVAHWTARQKVDKGLGSSLAHPLVADLEGGFAHVAASDSLHRATSNSSKIKEKQQVLIDLCRAGDEEQNILQSRVSSLRVSRTRILQENDS